MHNALRVCGAGAEPCGHLGSSPARPPHHPPPHPPFYCDQAELQKAAKLKQKALKLAAEQKEQLEVYTQEYIKRLTDERLEGELVRKKALEEIEKDKLVEEARRRQARQNNLGTHTTVAAVAVCRALTRRLLVGPQT